MNRRQFLGASLSTSIASAVLPWERFLEWFKSWFGEVKRKGVSQLKDFAELLKERYADTDVLQELVYGDSPLMAWLDVPRQFGEVRA